MSRNYSPFNIANFKPKDCTFCWKNQYITVQAFTGDDQKLVDNFWTPADHHTCGKHGSLGRDDPEKDIYSVLRKDILCNMQGKNSKCEFDPVLSANNFLGKAINTDVPAIGAELLPLINESFALNASVSKDFEVFLGMTDLAVFEALGITTQISIQLTDPNGQKLTPQSASSFPNVIYSLDDFGNHFGIVNPVPGLWKVNINNLAGAGIAAMAVRTNDIWSILGRTDKDNYPPGVQGYVACNVNSKPTGTQLTSIQAKVLNDALDVLQTLTLYDDGSHQDSAANDGIWSSHFTTPAPPGFYHITITATGTRNGVPFQKMATTAFNVLAQNPIFYGNFTDRADDSDGDGKFDQLLEKVGLNIPDAGDYVLVGQLQDNGSYPLAEARVQFNVAAPGLVQPELAFDLKAIGCTQFKGAFKVKGLFLAKQSPLMILSQWSSDVVTNVYNSANFNCQASVLPAPTISSIDQNFIFPGEAKQIIINGTGFQSSAKVNIGGGLTLSGLSRLNSTSIILNVIADKTTAPGVRDVTVTNGDERSVTATNAFIRVRIHPDVPFKSRLASHWPRSRPIAARA